MKITQRLRYGLAVNIIIGGLVVAGLVFLAISCFFALRAEFAPDIAALFTALSCLVIAAIFFGVWRLTLNQTETKLPIPGAGDDDPVDSLERILQRYANPTVSQWARREPQRAAGLSIFAGFAVGCSPFLQRLVKRGVAEHTRGSDSDD